MGSGSGLSMKVSALSRTSLGTTACTRGSAPFRSSGKKCCHRRPRLAANLCGWNSVRPSHLFGRYSDHDYYFELPCGSGAPNQFGGDLRHTMNQLRATPRANRPSKFADNPMPCATSNTVAPPACGPSRPWRSVQEPTPPVGIVAYDGVSRLDQQETQECVALLADVAEALPAASRFLARNQSQIAAYLLATLKALRNPKNQDKGQCRDGANPRMRHQPLHLWPLFRGLLNRCTQFVDLRVESVQ